jgi:hypothetical protein
VQEHELSEAIDVIADGEVMMSIVNIVMFEVVFLALIGLA